MIQPQQRPLSDPEKIAIEKVLVAPGFQRLKDVILAREATCMVEAAEASIENKDDGIECSEKIAHARFYRWMYRELVEIEGEPSKLFLIDLKIHREVSDNK